MANEGVRESARERAHCVGAESTPIAEPASSRVLATKHTSMMIPSDTNLHALLAMAYGTDNKSIALDDGVSPATEEWVQAHDASASPLLPTWAAPSLSAELCVCDERVGETTNRSTESTMTRKEGDVADDSVSKRVPLLCPLCFSCQVHDPVSLHPSVAQRSSSNAQKEVQQQSSQPSCVACHTCVMRWREIHAWTRAAWLCPLCHVRISASHDSNGDAQEMPKTEDESHMPWVARAPGEDDATCANARNVCTQDDSDVSDVDDGAYTEHDAARLATSHAWSNRHVDTHESSKCDGANTHNNKTRRTKKNEPSATSVCGVCESAGSATLMCLQCQFALCLSCQRSGAHSQGLFRTHTVVPLDKARQHRQHRCPHHRAEYTELFCQSCRVCVCVRCCFGGAHSGHDIHPLQESVTAVTRMLEGKASVLQACGQTVQQTGESMRTTLLPRFDTAVQRVEEQITVIFARLREALTRREGELRSGLHTQAATRRDEVCAVMHACHTLAEALSVSIHELHELPSCVDRVTLMRVATALPGSLEAVHGAAQCAASRAEDMYTSLCTQLIHGRLAQFDLTSEGSVNPAVLATTSLPASSSSLALSRTDAYPDVMSALLHQLGCLGQLRVTSSVETELESDAKRDTALPDQISRVTQSPCSSQDEMQKLSFHNNTKCSFSQQQQQQQSTTQRDTVTHVGVPGSCVVSELDIGARYTEAHVVRKGSEGGDAGRKGNDLYAGDGWYHAYKGDKHEYGAVGMRRVSIASTEKTAGAAVKREEQMCASSAHSALEFATSLTENFRPGNKRVLDSFGSTGNTQSNETSDALLSRNKMARSGIGEVSETYRMALADTGISTRLPHPDRHATCDAPPYTGAPLMSNLTDVIKGRNTCRTSNQSAAKLVLDI